MGKSNTLQDAIPDLEYVAAKYKYVLENIPDCIIQKVFHGYITKSPIFAAKSINQSYTDLDFFCNKNIAAVVPYSKLPFTYKDKTEDIIIHSLPKKSTLAKITFDRVGGTYIRTLRFSRLSFNMKNNNFDEKMLNQCHTNIIKFMKMNTDAKVDMKHLEPRLKKILVFS